MDSSNLVTIQNNTGNKLHILHIVQYDFHTFKGGIQRYVKELAELQAVKGHSVTIYSCSKIKSTEIINGVIIKRFRYFEILRTPISLDMIISLLKEQFDLVHIHAQFPLIAEIATIVAKLKGIPVVITYHNEIDLVNLSFFGKLAYNIWSKTLLRLMLSISRSIIVTNKEFAMTSRLLNKSRYNEKITVIPCGILYHIHLHHNNIIYPKDYLLYVGRIKPEKGLHILIEALHLLKEHGIDINLVIIGEATRKEEMTYKKKLEDLITQLNLINNIKFVGSVSDEDLATYYTNAIALVLPSVSRLEGFGIVQLEAIKYDLPIIVSDIPGPRSVAKGSILFRPNDVIDLANSILKVMDERTRRDIIATYQHIKDEYDWHKLIDKIEEIYKNSIK